MTVTTAAYRECSLYVDADDVDALTATMASWFGPVQRFHRFAPAGFTIDVVKNGRRLPHQPDTFIDWSVIVEIDAGATPDAEAVRFVTELMGLLRSAGRRVVAVCDFEDELPQTDLD
ncbi:MAG TPA: hypothetical protein VI357_02640 [Mycobacteriales bacterium]